MMADSDAAAKAGGRAAKERALASSWPPTEEDYEATGAAGAAAVCIAYGASAASPLCAAVGSAVGSGVYQLVTAVGNGLDPRAQYPQCYEFQKVFLPQARSFIAGFTAELARTCGTSQEHELAQLMRWGAPVLSNGGPSRVTERFCFQGSDGVWYASGPRLERVAAQWQKEVWAAAAGRSVECTTRRVLLSPAVLRGFVPRSAPERFWDTLAMGLRGLAQLFR